jgi:hypothetical protein
MSNPYPHIQHLRQQINTLHQASREERIKLAAWEDDRPFSILGELEILASTIQGYVGQFTNQQLNYPTAAIADLQQRNPFAIPELAEWYSVDGENYPNLCRYLELLDYLRLSLLTIIQTNNLQAA